MDGRSACQPTTPGYKTSANGAITSVPAGFPVAFIRYPLADKPCRRIVLWSRFNDNSAMGTLLVTGLIACVSLFYATAGQAGGTTFLPILAFAGFPAAELRATALTLNIVAAGYATWRLRRKVCDRPRANIRSGEARPIRVLPASMVGAIAGLISGLTGVGGGGS
jgi:uncharacterized membrane protein YfcA